jgi:hypothetical protein
VYTVLKNLMEHNGKIFSQGEQLELPPEEALFLQSQGVVIPAISNVATDDASGVIAELTQKLSEAEDKIKTQATQISTLQKDVMQKDIQIKNLTATVAKK